MYLFVLYYFSFIMQFSRFWSNLTGFFPKIWKSHDFLTLKAGRSQMMQLKLSIMDMLYSWQQEEEIIVENIFTHERGNWIGNNVLLNSKLLICPLMFEYNIGFHLASPVLKNLFWGKLSIAESILRCQWCSLQRGLSVLLKTLEKQSMKA